MKQPYVIATLDQAFLVVDCQIIGEVNVKKLPLYILAAYFVFNVEYIKGCRNFFSYLEILLLGAKPEKATASVKHFMATIQLQ